MFYHLKIILRNLRRSGIYSFINIAGLAVSLAACILIMLWVWHELSYDKFHRNANRIYGINTHIEAWSTFSSPYPLADFVLAELPTVEKFCRLDYNNINIQYIEYNGEKFYNNDGQIAATDTSFFSMFDFKLLKGSAKDLTYDALIISESVEKKLFGNGESLGELVKTSDGQLFRIAGVMADLPSNTSIRLSILKRLPLPQHENWDLFNYFTFLLLQPNSDPDAVAKDITALTRKKQPDLTDLPTFKMTLQRLTTQHLYTPDGKDRGMQSVRLFMLIAGLILVIAGINYVNLVTARATKRNREIGLRKVVGASKINLMGQLLGEAVILFLLAIVLALGIVVLVLPLYNTLTTKSFDIITYFPQILVICAASFVAIMLLAGLYPAFLLSSFKPTEAFKNKSGSSKNTLFRKVLVVIQFVFSTGLIMGTFVMGRQLAYIQSMNPGYDRENVLTVLLHNMNLNTVRGELLNVPGITGVTASDGYICRIGSAAGLVWEGKNPNELSMIARIDVESNFLTTMGLKLVKGSDFTGTDADKDVCIINEAAARLMAFDDPIGKRIEFGMEKGSVIIGVVNDFNFHNMYETIGPLVLYNTAPNNHQLLYVRIAPGKTQSAIAQIEKIWNRTNSEYPFNYSFVDETFAKMHRDDMLKGMLFNIFAVIAIIISSLGLFGLVTYTAETKKKEIAIRKVLGASVSEIIVMLSKDFLILVGIAMVIAFPLAYWLFNGMLENFAYRISITWWMFAVAALIVIALTLFTVGFQAYKAATANPVKAIKSE